MSSMFRKKKPLILFLLPTLIYMGLFLYYPFVMNISNSIHEIKGLGQAAEAVNSPWFLNYRQIFEDPKIWTALRNTLIFTVCTVVFQVGIGLVLALIVDNIRRGAKFFQTVYFFPIVISATALGLMFNLIFLYKGGMINHILLNVFHQKELIDWKGDKYWLVTMLIPTMWQYVGYYFVILMTGLNNISSDIYEAAVIDGVTKWQKIRYISWPLLHNTLCTCVILAITGSLKIFDLPWTMFPNGLPMEKSWLLSTYMYKQTFIASDVDYGSTIAILIVVIGIIMAQIANKVFKEKDY